jgi:hypothetical protein
MIVALHCRMLFLPKYLPSYKEVPFAGTSGNLKKLLLTGFSATFGSKFGELAERHHCCVPQVPALETTYTLHLPATTKHPALPLSSLSQVSPLGLGHKLRYCKHHK